MKTESEAALTPQEVADDLVVHVTTVRRWIVSGDLPAIDLGSSYRIDRAVYRAWKKARETKGGLS